MKSRRSTALHIVQKEFPQVTNVIDADKPITIEVTEADSKNARLKNHKKCALAEACKRKEHADGVLISIGTAYVIKGNRAIRYRVPELTAREIVSFDRHGGFQPGVYELKTNHASAKIGADHRGGSYTGTGKRRTKHRTENIRTSLTI
jgi:hypothetical protein